MKVDTQTLVDLLALPGLPDDFEIRLEVTITKGEFRRSMAAGSGAPRDLSLVDMAESVGRSLSTVRGWLADGKVAEAYKLNNRDWFCPPEAWVGFLETRKRRAPVEIAEEAEPAVEAGAVKIGDHRRRKGLTMDSWRDVVPAARQANGKGGR